jgi:hypothetical protein
MVDDTNFQLSSFGCRDKADAVFCNIDNCLPRVLMDKGLSMDGCVAYGPGSVAFNRRLSDVTIGCIVGVILFVGLMALCKARANGWRLRNGRCKKVDLDAEAEEAAEKESRRVADLRRQFHAIENPLAGGGGEARGTAPRQPTSATAKW